MTMEQLGWCDPEPDPTPLPRRTRRPAADNHDAWQAAQTQYEAHLDRMGGES